jgi:hypothetical protein
MSTFTLPTVTNFMTTTFAGQENVTISKWEMNGQAVYSPLTTCCQSAVTYGANASDGIEKCICKACHKLTDERFGMGWTTTDDMIKGIAWSNA